MFTVQIQTTDLSRLSRQIRREADPTRLRRDLVAGMRTGARPALEAVKAAALQLPDGPPQASTGLRRRAAAAASLQVRTSGRRAGVKVRIARRRMGDQASLIRATNRGRWRHQVYGTSRWVTQTSRRGWFDQAAKSRAPHVRRAVAAVMTDLERRMAHN